MTIQTIPFSKLVAVDAINARASTKDGLDELAASIAAKGLTEDGRRRAGQTDNVRPADLKACTRWQTTLMDGARGSWSHHHACLDHPRFAFVKSCRGRGQPAVLEYFVDGTRVATLDDVCTRLNQPEETADADRG